MRYTVLEIIEDDFGCEGLPDGEERMVTLVLRAPDGAVVQRRMADRLAYELDIREGSTADLEEN